MGKNDKGKKHWIKQEYEKLIALGLVDPPDKMGKVELHENPDGTVVLTGDAALMRLIRVLSTSDDPVAEYRADGVVSANEQS